MSVGIQLGKTKVFLRHHAFNALEQLRGQKQRQSATRIQSIFRMYYFKTRFQRICHSALVLQCRFRSYQARKSLLYLRESKNAVIIQSAWRGFVDYSSYSYTLFLISWCQRVHRGNIARARVRVMSLDKKASLIQSWWRMISARKQYLALSQVAFNLQQLYRNKKARGILRQLKIEAKDVSRISRERDKLKEEIAAMKLKEEQWIKSMKQEVKSPPSQTLTPAQNDELEQLRKDSKRKDVEIMELKNKIEELQDIVRRNRSENNTAAETTPILFDSKNSTNLLDADQHLKTPHTKSTALNMSNESWSVSEESSQLLPTALNFDTPIHTAIRAADDDALSVAITNCEHIACEINRGGRDGKSPLHLAVLNSNIASAEFLLQNQSVANTQDNDGNTPLHYAESSSMVKVLLDVGKANPNIPNESGICAIHIAVRRRDLESVRLLIEHRANINAADDTKWYTPLHLIAQSFNFYGSGQSGSELKTFTIEIANALLDAKVPFQADVDYQDKDGNTPLHHATVLSSHIAGDLISLLLKKKARTNIRNNRGQTALHLVLHNMNLRKFDFYNDLVQLLLYHGSDTSVVSFSGCTPLHLALYHQDTKNAILLVENGAQLHFPWEKPARWQAHWIEHGSTNNQVYALEMIEDEEIRFALISAIKSKQNKAPLRSNCMHCKRKIGRFVKSKNCEHCGSLVCGSCAPNTLDNSFFPAYCDIKESEGSACQICEALLISRKRDENIMGREIMAIHGRQEDVSFLDMEANQLGDGNIQQLQVEM